MTTSGVTSSDYGAELGAARESARAAGGLLGAAAGRPHPARAKDDGSPVTTLDLQADRLIQDRLRAAFPDDVIVTEESRLAPPEDGIRFWLVDPLDGTRDFAAGLPEFAVHVALISGGSPVVAVVHQPARGVLFEAVRGEGARRIGPDGRVETLRVSDCVKLSEFRTGISPRAAGERLTRMLADSVLGPGAVPLGASLKLTAVAAGELEATLCLHDREKSWDTAAPGLIITEAGGRITDVDGRPFVYRSGDQAHRRGIISSNGPCHEALCALARRYWPRS